MEAVHWEINVKGQGGELLRGVMSQLYCENIERCDTRKSDSRKQSKLGSRRWHQIV